MLKAKLVVKQGRKVMGLYIEDRQAAQFYMLIDSLSTFFTP